jgi:hypothetical protein
MKRNTTAAENGLKFYHQENPGQVPPEEEILDDEEEETSKIGGSFRIIW